MPSERSGLITSEKVIDRGKHLAPGGTVPERLGKEAAFPEGFSRWRAGGFAGIRDEETVFKGGKGSGLWLCRSVAG